MAKSNLVNETIMYSINSGGGEVLVHRLPFGRENPQLETYVERGFTFERPNTDKDIIAVVKILDNAPIPTKGRMLHDGDKIVGVTCPKCGFVAKSEFGLSVHMRRRKK